MATAEAARAAGGQTSVRRAFGKRAFDLAFAIPMAILTAPVILLSAVAIYLSDPGPAIFRARRSGLNNRPFTLFKLRSMRIPKPGQELPKITAGGSDPRVFAFGKFIRATKIDELPQFWNVILGDMAVVGPRPEDPDMVERFYTPFDLETLNVPPGLTSPGSLYASTHGDDQLDGDGDAEIAYAGKVMPLRNALEHVYMERQSVGYDIWVVLRTIGLVAGKMVGKSNWRAQPEVPAAQTHLARRRSEAGV